MKPSLGILLATAALSRAAAEVLPELALADMHGLGGPAARQAESAACPPKFPRYCPVGGLCCTTSKCCPKACCLESARFCYQGHCYS